MTAKTIDIKGAKVHNLKNVDVSIPKNQLVVITGVSGSGKSSLAIDTLYAEGQRRYVESLSSYARQFLDRMDKPEVDYIHGIAPAISIEQKVVSSNSRSTVGSLTEIYDYLKLLFARIGKTISPISGQEVKSDSVSDVVQKIVSSFAQKKVQLFIQFDQKNFKTPKDALDFWIQKGFNRALYKNELFFFEDYLEKPTKVDFSKVHILIDRFKVAEDNEKNRNRIADSIQLAYSEGHQECFIKVEDEFIKFNNRFELDGMSFQRPSTEMLTFNNPYGACPTCQGFGKVIGIDELLVIPNPALSVYEGAIAPWQGEKMKKWEHSIIENAHHFDFPIHTPYKQLTEEQKELLWDGNKYFKGIHKFFKYLESKTYKIQFRVMLSRYRGRTTCFDCKGSRLRKETNYIKINSTTIQQLLLMPLDELLVLVESWTFEDNDAKIAERLLIEITHRATLMVKVGLGYLTLNRPANTLSGGESQRIHLTRMLGSNLTSSLYILDEPSIGLHPKDTTKLIEVLQELKQLGNTIIVVEHDEDVMKAADYIVDMGPQAGINGGNVVFTGNHDDLIKKGVGLTYEYLTGKKKVEVNSNTTKAKHFLELSGAQLHNLKDVSVKIPMNQLSVITGVSGSGKTTLVKQVLYPALTRLVNDEPIDHLPFVEEITYPKAFITAVEFINQSPIGKSSRSNPVTYVKAYDAIRDLFAAQPLSKIRGYKPKHFSFNVEGGRCETCKGEGEITVEMQFLADVKLQCDDCHGNRFQADVLEVRYREKSISEILDLTVDEALEFFAEVKQVINKIKPLQDVGLGYVSLGQSSNTLSGGEAQRVKLASYLSKGKRLKPLLFIFDEPTTGLHFDDINKLLKSFYALIENGHTIIVVEHNLDLIACADWIVDLGPDGGKHGGNLVFQGTVKGITKCKASHTGQFLKGKV